MKLAVIGLGRMGRGITASLLRAGHDLAVYNRSADKAEALAHRGARVARSPADAARGADAVLTMLADDAALSDIVLREGDGLVAGLGRGAIHVSMSTIAPATAVRLADAHRRAGQSTSRPPCWGGPTPRKRRSSWSSPRETPRHSTRAGRSSKPSGAGRTASGRTSPRRTR